MGMESIEFSLAMLRLKRLSNASILNIQYSKKAVDYETKQKHLQIASKYRLGRLFVYFPNSIVQLDLFNTRNEF